MAEVKFRKVCSLGIDLLIPKEGVKYEYANKRFKEFLLTFNEVESLIGKIQVITNP